MPLIYTKTWEDSSIELQAIKEVYHKTIVPNILSLDPAGDTLIQLIRHYPERISRITVVNPYNSQLNLVELKVVISQITKLQEFYDFFHGKLSKERTKELYDQVSNLLHSQKYWDEYYELLDKGLQNYDSYTILFNHLYKANPQPTYETFKQIFTTKTLTQLFDQNYIKNSYLTRPASHFYHYTYQKAQQDSHPIIQTNQILNQPTTPRLDPKTNYKMIETSMPNYHFIYTHKDPLQFLEKYRNQHELIHLSNYTDQLNEPEIIQLLEILQHRLTPCGRITFRRLNGNIPLEPLVIQFFIILNFERDLTDHTHFYREVIMATTRCR